MTGIDFLFFFFFQAEDGIRDGTVTGVQTCALPIYAYLLGLHVAGDVKPEQVRMLAEKYFGDIGRGPANIPAAASVPTLPRARTVEMKDHVATTSITHYWAVPGLLDARMPALDIGTSVLGGLASSRLDEQLVRKEKIAVSVSASLSAFQRVGILTVSANVRPG